MASVQFSHSVVSDSLQPHGLQHASLPCPSPTPGACSNSCPSSQWCHPSISSSVVPFSSCLQSFWASGSFPMSQFFISGGQSIGVSQITSPGWMHETGAQGWCTGKTQRDGMEREAGGGIGMGNTCKSMADLCQCMAKITTILKSN